MFKITQDRKPERYRVFYYPVVTLTHLYEIENLTWDYLKDMIKDIVSDWNDLIWMKDLVRLLNKEILLSESGEWHVV